MAERTLLRPYRKMLSAQVRAKAQYRVSFTVDIAVQTVFSALDFITIIVMFGVTPALGGFGLGEVLVITGIASAAFALADMLAGNVELLKTYVRTGLLDAVLIRPRRVLGQLLVLDFQFRRIGRVAFGTVVLIVAVCLADIDWNWWRLLLIVTVPLAATLYFCAVFVTTASVAFWWIESGEFANGFTYGGRDFTIYPINVFEGFFRRFFAFGLGFGFVAYYPALLILGKPDPLGMPGWFGWGIFPVALLATAIAVLVWSTGIRHYKGTGS